MYKLCFYVPIEHAATVKAAVFATGAGRIGDYSQCSWETAGTGQFCGEAGSDPFLGQQGELESVEELKVELVCGDECIAAAIDALVKAHPYEEPAYHYWLVNSKPISSG